MAEGFGAVVIAAPFRQAAAADSVRLAGGHVVATLDWDRASDLPAHLATLPIISIEAEGVAEAMLDAALPAIATAIQEFGLRGVVTLDTAQIDMIANALMSPEVELLCAPTLARQVAALAVAGRIAATSGLGDRVREDEVDREREIAAEIARIADLLARQPERERGGGSGGVGDRRQSFGFETTAVVIDAQTVRAAIRGRRMRDAFLGEGLFEDPAWDMLLDLFAAHLESRRVSVSSLCIASAVAPTTALRWIGRLTEAGLLERRPDPDDRRRAFMVLSLHALAGMEGYAAALRRAGLPFA
jgi:DNA-binding transcriptional ArsR family regulator